MIPLQIKLKNFLSYGPEFQTIDFQDHHLICLTGRNGHGKSALLEALTWSLWGQARKTSNTVKADQGLLRLGQSHIVVILDFLCANNKYRVKREYIAGKVKAHLYLDFGIYDPDTELIRPLTDKTVRATQQAINTVLGIDYETFTSSAFIRQGQSNQFSTKSPQERKQILGTLLGLDRFEKVRKLVLEKQRLLTTKKDSLSIMLERLQHELEQEASITAARNQLQQEMHEMNGRGHELHTALQTHILKKNTLINEHQKVTLLHIEYDHLCQRRKGYQQELHDLILAWRSTHHRARNITHHKALQLRKKEVDELIATLTNKYYELGALKEKLFTAKEREQEVIREYEKDFSKALHHNDLEQANLVQRQSFINNQARECDQLIKKISAALTTNLSSYTPFPLSEGETWLKDLEKRLVERQATYARLVARSHHLAKDLEKTKKKIVLVSDHASCPLCEQSLAPEYKLSLQHKLRSKESLSNHQYARLAIILRTATTALQQEHAQVTTQRENYKKYLELNERLKEAQHQKKLLSEQYQELLLLMRNIHQQRQGLLKQQSSWHKHHDEYQKLKETIQLYTDALTTQSYDEKLHQALGQEQQELRQLLDHQESFFEEMLQQPARKAKIHELCTTIRQLKYAMQSLERALCDSNTLTSAINHLDHEIQTLEHQLNEFNHVKSSLIEKKGRLEQAHHHIAHQKREAEALATEIRIGEQQVKKHQSIATALSKDGIQALLLEDVLPEIEYEANRLLAKLTDNTQQIFIESLRDLKHGGTKETLDIKISDAIGIRPYELFSGGEAFRIDFALRIALATLIARRAGASLQTLIIDEGFGSQDEEGLSNIMDALHRIHENFAKIIIVSHLPSMHHQFPSQFHITKGPQGSQVQIREQG